MLILFVLILPGYKNNSTTDTNTGTLTKQKREK